MPIQRGVGRHAAFTAGCLLLFGLLGAREGNARESGPALFFTDLTSGPSRGGQDDLGAFVTLYGEGFGAQRGSSTVTFGGIEVVRYVSWGEDNAPARSLDRIVVQPGPSAASGDIVVTVGGRASNPLPFTVRTGNVYFVIPGASNASDTNPGTYAAPFKSLYRPRQVLQAGDTVYIRGGTFTAADPEHAGWDATLLLSPDTDPSGTPDRPIAYVGYPGEPPVLGAPQPMRRAILVDQAMNSYTFANLRFTNYSGTLQLSGNGHRAVGNSSYDGIFSNSGVIGVSGSCAHHRILGNLIRNNGEVDHKLNGSGVYLQGFGLNQDIEIGWNQVQDQHGARAIQVYGHADGDRMDDVRIHDNLLTGSELNNIVLGGSDGATEVLGTVRVTNNVIVGSGEAGFRVNDPQGTVLFQNNVLYGNGTRGVDGPAQVHIQRAGAGKITFQNNILYAGTGQAYYVFEPGVGPSVFASSSNNLVFNAGPCPAWDVGCVNADPLFASAASLDFQLLAQSPAIDRGTNSGVTRDYAGIPRPQGAAYDIGAHEYVAGGAGPAPTIQASGPTTFCAGGSVALTASIAPEAGVSYLWSPGGETTRTVNATASGSYTVTVKVNGVSGTSPATVVTVNPIPATPVISSPTSATPGQAGLGASVASHAGSTYAWGITNGTITAGQGTSSITFTAGTAGSLSLSVVETTAGCPSRGAGAVVPVVAGAACTVDQETLCLAGGRFRVRATFRNYAEGPAGATHRASAVGLTGDTGYFWFFATANVEVVIKVLDFGQGRFLVMYGALSDMEYDITVEDIAGARSHVYHNPPYNLASVADGTTFR